MHNDLETRQSDIHVRFFSGYIYQGESDACVTRIQNFVYTTCLKEEVLDFLGSTPRFGSSFVLGSCGHSFELREVADEIQILWLVPHSHLLLDKDLVRFRDKQYGEEDEDRAVGKDKVGCRKRVWKEHVVAREKEDDR